MGFPQRSAESAAAAVYVGSEVVLASGGYTCPRCQARVVELPCQCHVCNLTLISSPHLARSYHHLFPVVPFSELPRAPAPGPGCGPGSGGGARGGSEPRSCFGCLKELGGGGGAGGAGAKPAQQPMVLMCPLCKHTFCFGCDTYIHESLHNCPGCECRQLGGGGGFRGEGDEGGGAGG